MDQKYDFDGWSSRWDEDRIGFHVAKPNPFLLQYWHHLDEIKPKFDFFIHGYIFSLYPTNLILS